MLLAECGIDCHGFSVGSYAFAIVGSCGGSLPFPPRSG
jgi:hypothetical protein